MYIKENSKLFNLGVNDLDLKGYLNNGILNN